MICAKCKNAIICDHIRYAVNHDFNINNCKNFILNDIYKYIKIAEDEDLLLLIYNYFTDEEELYSLYTKEEIEKIIQREIKNL